MGSNTSLCLVFLLRYEFEIFSGQYLKVNAYLSPLLADVSHVVCYKWINGFRYALKTIVEDLYIFSAMAAVILTWKGVGMAVDTLAQRFPVHCGDCDVTGLCSNLASFILLSLCYVSGSLVGKGAEVDGATSGGSGVEFSTAYFGAFFEDFIAERDRQQTKTTTSPISTEPKKMR